MVSTIGGGYRPSTMKVSDQNKLLAVAKSVATSTPRYSTATPCIIDGEEYIASVHPDEALIRANTVLKKDCLVISIDLYPVDPGKTTWEIVKMLQIWGILSTSYI